MRASLLFWGVFGYCLFFWGSFTVITPVSTVGLPIINDFITHFEPVYYDRHRLKRTQQRSKRSSNGAVSVQLFATNRIFSMKLQKDKNIFADDVVFESSQGAVKYDTSRVFTGSLEDDVNSVVQGVLTDDGLFDGTIVTSDGTEFNLEPATRYYSNASTDFQSLVYRTSEVRFPRMNVTTCRSAELLSSAVVARHRRRKRMRVNKEHRRRHKILVPPSPQTGSTKKKRTKNGKIELSSGEIGEYFYYSNQVFDDEVSVISSSTKSVFSDLGGGGGGHDRSSSSESNSIVNFSVVSESDEDGAAGADDEQKPVITSAYDDHLEGMMRRDYERTNTFSDGHWLWTSMVDQAATDTKSSSPIFSSNWKRRRSRRQRMPYNNELQQDDDTKQTASAGSSSAGLPPRPLNLAVADAFQHKRAVIDPKKTTCMLYLQADHLFYQKMGNIEACIETMTRHVQKVNSIYRVTDFDQDGRLDNISFMIKRIKVHTEEALQDPEYRFPGNYGVEKFLELFSEEDYDAFCLAYMFTYRDFEGGTLGLAWTGDLKNAGGVCEKNGHYRGSLKSLNTGIVTLLNYGKHVPPAVSHVTLAHEIGHNFGSPHDPEDNRACTPGGEDGNYIMFARATSGDKRNNNKFSPCSLRSINAVLNTKARGNKGCFTEPQESICGNEVVERGEECDCGWEEDCKESCCFPMRVNPPKNEPPCQLRPNKTCSPSQGPCCNSECRLQTGTKCRDDNGCRDASFCNGLGPKCPPSINKPNKTVCNEGFVCYMGECTGSICIAYGLESCQCRRDKEDPVTKACELCCKLPGEDQACRSSFLWNSTPYEIPGMYAKPGTPCDNYNGYCDMFQKCREVDPSGPLATLRKLLLSTESIASVKKWITDNWLGVVFMVVGFIIMLVAIVRIFGKSPDLKLKAAENCAVTSHRYSGSSNFAFPPLIAQHPVIVARANYNPVTMTAANSNHVVNGCPIGASIKPTGWV